MEKKKRFLWLGVALVFLIGLGKGVKANPLGSFISGWKEVANNLILEPKWHLTTEVKLDRNSLINVWERKDDFYTNPLIPTYKTTLRVGAPDKLNLGFTHWLQPYTESQISNFSSGSEKFSLKASYPIKPDYLVIDADFGWSKNRSGPGTGTYNPFVAARTGGGSTERRIESIDRFGAGLNLTLPSLAKRVLDLQVSLGGERRGYLYPSSLKKVSEKPNEVGKMNMYVDFTTTLTLSPKFKVTSRGNLVPSQVDRYYNYATGDYDETYYTSKSIEIGFEYKLNPVLKVECGYSYYGDISEESPSEETLWGGGEEFFLPQKTRTATDEFKMKVVFHP